MPTKATQPAKANRNPYSWTVMVYLAGDNNLTEESVFSLTEMKNANTDSQIAVIAQLDPRSRHIPTHRYAIKTKEGGSRGGGSPSGPIAENAQPIPPAKAFGDPAPGNGETDTGDPATLYEFIRWGTEEYPADRYMVILAGHGAGTEEDFLLRDDHPASTLTIPGLRKVFAAVQENLGTTIDILGMDVCLMSMAEICHELRGFVRYIVASESYSPAAGWPYRQILEGLSVEVRRNRKAEPEALSRIVVREYIRFYSDYVVGGLSVDQAVLKVVASKRLIESIKQLGKRMRDELKAPRRKRDAFRDALVLAHWEAQSYNGELFVDLRDFCELLATRHQEVRERCNDVVKAIRRQVRLSCFSGPEYQFSKGLSIYFPWDEVSPAYTQLEFAKDSEWSLFLEDYVKRTRRNPRGFKSRTRTQNESRLLLSSRSMAADARKADDRKADDRKADDRKADDRKADDRKADDRKADDRKADDRKVSDRGGNPIRSMRNPPQELVEVECKRVLRKCMESEDAAAVVNALRRFPSINQGH